MNSQEIQSVLAHVPGFRGVFPLDQLPHGLRANDSFVFNLDSSNLPGTHWLAVKIDSHLHAFLFDPLAFPANRKICRHLLNYVVSIRVCKEPSQSLNSSLCGEYCVDFIISQ